MKGTKRCDCGGFVFFAYYWTGFTDYPATLLDVCDSRRTANAVIREHKRIRDVAFENCHRANWWIKRQAIRTDARRVVGKRAGADRRRSARGRVRRLRVAHVHRNAEPRQPAQGYRQRAGASGARVGLGCDGGCMTDEQKALHAEIQRIKATGTEKERKNLHALVTRLIDDDCNDYDLAYSARRMGPTSHSQSRSPSFGKWKRDDEEL